MDTLEAPSWWDSGAIDNKVPNLAQENVGRDPSRFAIVIVVRTCVNQSKSVKIRGSLEHWKISRIPDELSHVVEDYGLSDEVGARWNVHNSRSVGGRVTNPRATSVAIGDGSIDSIRIIIDAWT